MNIQAKAAQISNQVYTFGTTIIEIPDESGPRRHFDKTEIMTAIEGRHP